MVVSVTVDNYCSSLGVCGILCRNVAGVDVLVVPAGSPDVLKDTLGLQAVVPGGGAGHQGIGLMAGAVDIGNAVRVGRKGEVRHELAGHTACH